LVDYDAVDLGNLHRQILHTEARVGLAKAASAASSCNKSVQQPRFNQFILSVVVANINDTITVEN